ncbi:type II toxin-antitoxin system VapB family antitoxin [Rhodopila sp.]|uniref:type II toxin-antitoxin system VapB family antitoxin n=1 Tax=Rhodopila sp. TaxID=2480087 RepID=UPI003D0FFC87
MYLTAFHVRDCDTDIAVRRLARLKGKSLTETIREAVEHEYAAISEMPSLIDRLRPIQAQFLALKQPGGDPADKAFFDDLSGQADVR